MPTIEKLLRGIVQYQTRMKSSLLEKFKAVKENPQRTSAVMFSCMDSRVLITRLLGSDVGDMFLVRNAGNLVPHSKTLTADAVSTEPGALELGCVVNKIRHVLVCGHSDCKAMAGLYGLRDDLTNKSGTPLPLWLKKHGAASAEKYRQLLETPGGHGAIQFQAETPDKYFDAYIDEGDNFDPVDKLSQVNTLQQIENISSYSFLQDKISSDQLHVNALWFDINAADFFMFSRSKRRFVPVDNDNIEFLVDDGETTRDKTRQ